MLASSDTMFDVLDSAFSSIGEIYFRRFMRSHLTDKWLVSADFVIGGQDAVHDVFAFTIFPHYEEFSAMLARIAEIFPQDLKRTKVLTAEMVAFLRDTRRFHFCFLIEKDRRKTQSVGLARAVILRALGMVRCMETRGLPEAEENRRSYIQEFKKAEQASKAKRFNYQNFFDIHILSVLTATIMLWLVRHGDCKVIGLFPDRDKMTDGLDGIINDLAFINHSGFCRRRGLNPPKNVLAPSPVALRESVLFYDELVRVPDYVAGAISRLDYDSRTLTSDLPKHKDLIEKFASDNPNLLLIQLKESIVSLSASTIRLTAEKDRFPPVSLEDVSEYISAMAAGFRRPLVRTHRQGLLDHASQGPVLSRMLRSLLRGVAAGDRVCTEMFIGGA